VFAVDDPATAVPELIEAQASSSISDLAVDELSKSNLSEGRNPFSPGVVQEEFDPSALAVEGIVIGPHSVLALISGQIISVGERIGNYTVKEIKQGKVILVQLEEEFILRMANYQPLYRSMGASKYFVEFHNADLKKALRMLAKADSMNMIIPESAEGKVTVSFNNTDIVDVIASILRVNNLEYAMENNILRIGKAEQFKDGSDLKTLSMPLKYATAKDMGDLLKTFLSERGSATADDRTNTIVVKDHANVINNVRAFLISVDRKDAQVSIEAKIVDASTSFSRSLGIQWGMTSGADNIVLRGNQNVAAGPTTTITNSPNTGILSGLGADNPTSGIDILIGRLPGNTTLESQLSAAEANGVIRIISKPNVTTINNKAAKIRSGLKIFVKVDGGANQGPTLKEIDTGIELKVTPQITVNRMVKMLIEAVESEADFSKLTDGIPAILDNTASTTVLIPDGETAVIGGLLKVKTTKGRRQVPAIGDVPVLGWLFKSTTKTKDNNELMLFITPKIMDEDRLTVDSSETVLTKVQDAEEKN
jgi:type IV pilus assembly protein PilQ